MFFSTQAFYFRLTWLLGGSCLPAPEAWRDLRNTEATGTTIPLYESDGKRHRRILIST